MAMIYDAPCATEVVWISGPGSTLTLNLTLCNNTGPLQVKKTIIKNKSITLLRLLGCWYVLQFNKNIPMMRRILVTRRVCYGRILEKTVKYSPSLPEWLIQIISWDLCGLRMGLPLTVHGQSDDSLHLRDDSLKLWKRWKSQKNVLQRPLVY